MPGSQAQVLTVSLVARELSGSTSGDEDLIADWLKEAVALFEQTTGREIPKAERTEKLGSRGGPRLVLSHAPILSVASIELDSTTIDPDTYEIEDADAGILLRTSGTHWSSTEYGDGHSIRPTPTTHAPGRDYTVTYTAGWVTPYQIDNDASLSSSDRTLPYDIQRGLIDYTKMRWAQRTDDPSVKSESLMEWSAEYVDGRRVPSTVASAISSYRRPHQR